MGKRENDGNRHFLYFSQCFQLNYKRLLSLETFFYCRLHLLLILTSQKFGIRVNPIGNLFCLEFPQNIGQDQTLFGKKEKDLSVDILTLSQTIDFELKEFADDKFELYENSRNFEQFLLFPTVFSKDLYCRQ